MEKYKLQVEICEISKHGNVHIPKKFLKLLGWADGDKLATTVNLYGMFIVLEKLDIFGDMFIGKNGCIKFSDRFRQAMSWHNKLCLQYNKESNTLSLYANAEVATTCVFCGSEDTGLFINGYVICNRDLATIAGVEYSGSDTHAVARHEPGSTKISTLDGTGMLLIPSVFRRQLGWDNDVSLTLHVSELCITLIADTCGNVNADELGRIIVPKEIREKLGWNESDKIAVTLDLDDESIILSLEDKYVQECVFCGDANVKFRFNNYDICEYHLDMIKKLYERNF